MPIREGPKANLPLLERYTVGASDWCNIFYVMFLRDASGKANNEVAGATFWPDRTLCVIETSTVHAVGKTGPLGAHELGHMLGLIDLYPKDSDDEAIAQFRKRHYIDRLMYSLSQKALLLGVEPHRIHPEGELLLPEAITCRQCNRTR